MALVRVYQPANGPARIVTPAPAMREEGESDAAFIARIAAIAEAADPTLEGLVFADVDPATLPTEADREQWRIVNGEVVVDANAPAPIKAAQAERTAAATDLADQYAAAITRLSQIIDFTGTPPLAAVYEAIRDMARVQRRVLRYLESQR